MKYMRYKLIARQFQKTHKSFCCCCKLTLLVNKMFKKKNPVNYSKILAAGFPAEYHNPTLSVIKQYSKYLQYRTGNFTRY